VGLLTGGLTAVVLMFGAGMVAAMNSPLVGPEHQTIWPAGEAMALYRVPLRAGSDGGPVAHCLLAPDGEQTRSDYDIRIHEPVAPGFSGDAVIVCDQSLTLQTGVALTVSQVTRGPLITVPLFAVALGLLFLIPPFAHYWAKNPLVATLRRTLRMRPPD
jgi:hypothetical protein